MTEKATCPYCGGEMTRTDADEPLYFICIECGAESPTVIRQPGETEEAAWGRAEELALRRAEPENRVLTPEEIIAMDDGLPLWHDARALTLSGFADTKTVKEWLTYPPQMYGHSWRCWLRKPTDEERKAVKWDD